MVWVFVFVVGIEEEVGMGVVERVGGRWWG